MCYQAIEDLLGYALRTGLIEECDRTWASNALLQAMKLESWEGPQTARERPLEDILKELLDGAAARGVIQNEITSRDLFDTELMGMLTPRPAQVISEFRRRYQADPKEASSARTRTTSAVTALRGTGSGRPPPPTGSWTSPSTSPSRRRTPRPSLRRKQRPSGATRSACCAGRTRATPGGWGIPHGRICGSYPSPSKRSSGFSNTVPMSTTTSTASF